MLPLASSPDSVSMIAGDFFKETSGYEAMLPETFVVFQYRTKGFQSIAFYCISTCCTLAMLHSQTIQAHRLAVSLQKFNVGLVVAIVVIKALQQKQ